MGPPWELQVLLSIRYLSVAHILHTQWILAVNNNHNNINTVQQRKV